MTADNNGISIEEAARQFVIALGKDPKTILDVMVDDQDKPTLIRVRFADQDEPLIIEIGANTRQ